MGVALARTAASLACSERTLRRYINAGILHGRALDRYRFDLPEREERYAREHWGLLQALRRAARTERDARLLVLFGSTATGEDRPESDVDLLLVGRSENREGRAALGRRLGDAVGRRVHLIEMSDARRSPTLLADVLAEGRVIADRDGLWDELRSEQDTVAVDAAGEEADLLTRARRAVSAARGRSGR